MSEPDRRPGSDNPGLSEADFARMKQCRKGTYASALQGHGDVHSGKRYISRKDCADIRRLAGTRADLMDDRDGQLVQAPDLADEYGINESTIRRHLRGECTCDPPVAPKEFNGRVWVREGDQR